LPDFLAYRVPYTGTGIRSFSSIVIDAGRHWRVIFPYRCANQSSSHSPAFELAIVSSPPSLYDHGSPSFKPVMLENGMEILALQFIMEGDTVQIEVTSGQCLERLRRGKHEVVTSAFIVLAGSDPAVLHAGKPVSRVQAGPTASGMHREQASDSDLD